MIDPRLWYNLQQAVVVGNEDCAAKLNELLAYDNYEVVKEGSRYKLRDLTGARTTQSPDIVESFDRERCVRMNLR